MATRIKKAMGYGLTIEDWRAHCLLDINHDKCLGDELEEALAHVPRMLQYGGDDHLWKVIDDGWVTQFCSIADLIMSIGAYDDTSHVIFFPNEKLKKEWFRFDNDLDWYAATAGQTEMPDSYFRFTDTPIHPFRDGTPDCLRWWLTRFQILSPEAVGRLRPLVAEWWG